MLFLFILWIYLFEHRFCSCENRTTLPNLLNEDENDDGGGGEGGFYNILPKPTNHPLKKFYDCDCPFLPLTSPQNLTCDLKTNTIEKDTNSTTNNKSNKPYLLNKNKFNTKKFLFNHHKIMVASILAVAIGLSVGSAIAVMLDKQLMQAGLRKIFDILYIYIYIYIYIFFFFFFKFNNITVFLCVYLFIFILKSWK